MMIMERTQTEIRRGGLGQRTPQRQQTIQVVTCLIGPQEYGIPVAHVREIVRLPALLALAGAPESCCGMLQLRGGYIPVLDGRVIINLPPTYSLHNQVIIIGQDNAEMGLLVDHVNHVQVLPINQWTPFTKESATPILQGIITSEDRAVLLFNLDYMKQLMPVAKTAC